MCREVNLQLNKCCKTSCLLAAAWLLPAALAACWSGHLCPSLSQAANLVSQLLGLHCIWGLLLPLQCVMSQMQMLRSSSYLSRLLTDGLHACGR
jgi:hypothetical protein